MSITRGVLAQSPEPEAHDKVLDNKSRSNWNLEMLVFKDKSPGVLGEKPLGARTRTNNKLNPHKTPSPAHIGGRRVLSRHACSSQVKKK